MIFMLLVEEQKACSSSAPRRRLHVALHLEMQWPGRESERPDSRRTLAGAPLPSGNPRSRRPVIEEGLKPSATTPRIHFNDVTRARVLNHVDVFLVACISHCSARVLRSARVYCRRCATFDGVSPRAFLFRVGSGELCGSVSALLYVDSHVCVGLWRVLGANQCWDYRCT